MLHCFQIILHISILLHHLLQIVFFRLQQSRLRESSSPYCWAGHLADVDIGQGEIHPQLVATHLQHGVQAARAPATQKIRGFHPSNISELFMFHSRGDCSLDILGASPAHTRDQNNVVEEEEAAVLPDTDVDIIDVCRYYRYCSRYVQHLIQGLVLVVTRSCLSRFLAAATRSLCPSPWIITSSCRSCCCRV